MTRSIMVCSQGTAGTASDSSVAYGSWGSRVSHKLSSQCGEGEMETDTLACREPLWEPHNTSAQAGRLEGKKQMRTNKGNRKEPP